MPSIAELCEACKNKGAINESFTKIRSLNVSYAGLELGLVDYWSSSQSSSSNVDVWRMNFPNDHVGGSAKFNSGRVCCLASF